MKRYSNYRRRSESFRISELAQQLALHVGSSQTYTETFTFLSGEITVTVEGTKKDTSEIVDRKLPPKRPRLFTMVPYPKGKKCPRCGGTGRIR